MYQYSLPEHNIAILHGHSREKFSLIENTGEKKNNKDLLNIE